MAFRKDKDGSVRDDQSEHPLFAGIRRGVGGQPTAAVQRFPTPGELAANEALRFRVPNDDGKIFLGVIDAQIRESKLPGGGTARAAVGGHAIGFADDRHLCMVAGNRAGKGRSLIINNLLLFPGSAIVIDPKGDLAAETADHRARVLGQRVLLLDPYASAGPGCDAFAGSFNPLQWVDREDPDAMIVAASLIADALVVTAGESDVHWSEAGKQFLEAAILHVCTAPEFEGERTLATVHRVIAFDVEDDDFAKRMSQNEAASGAVVMGAMAYYSKSEKERSGVISTLRRHLHFLGYPKMQRVLSDSVFDLGALQRERVTLYLSLPAMMMGSCAGWLRLFVNLALNAFEANVKRREFQVRAGGHRVLLLLDEAAVLGRMERLEMAIGQVAGLGIRVWSIWQDLNQPAAIYGKRWESFIGNSSVLIFFGNADQTTLDYIEKRLGQTLVYSPAHRTPSMDAALKQGDLGHSYTLQTHPLMTAPEIARIFDRDDPMLRQLVFLPGIGPVILQRAFYDQHGLFLGLRKGR